VKPLKAEELLSAWEQGLNQPLLQRALILLAAGYPEVKPDALVELTTGQRDRHLLQLREYLFGQQLLNSAVCPECDERIEWENRIADLLIESDENSAEPNEFDLDVEDFSLRFRLPSSLDIATVVNSGSAEKAHQHLLTRCLLQVECSGTSCDVSELPDSIIEKLEQRIETLDPQAEIRISLTCPECSHSWNVLFDIAGYLWKEVNDWAVRMLQTVYRLAAGYGWSEREILNLSPVRRQLYLGMLA
jgi:hypothetical protein